MSTNTGNATQIPLSNMNSVLVLENPKALFNSNLGTVCKTEPEELLEYITDHEIIEKYGKDIIFDSVDDLEATIADLISKQLGGKSGKLLNHSDVNIFYVRVNGELHCVYVYWTSNPPAWYVNSYRIDFSHGSVGHCVFRNCGHLGVAL